MQAQHIIILAGLVVCFLLLTLFVERAIKRALRRSYWARKSAGVAHSSARLNALNADIAMLARRRERERRGFINSLELKKLAIREFDAQLTNSHICKQSQAEVQIFFETATTLDLAEKSCKSTKPAEQCRARASAGTASWNRVEKRNHDQVRATKVNLTTGPNRSGEAA
ncbi:hypothetical protein [Pseudomonas viridiflava]|uniref:hypothetical protein n=1 Tax=Pseudomonas viridiflava TaxID=33069 RepID=UPI000F032407|nr:hypothetical protein [Pseudomonas viridiflava]